MRQGARPTIATLLALTLAVVLAACGSSGDGTIPKADADQLIAELGGVQAAVEAGRCDEATDGARAFQQEVDTLAAEEVGADLKNGLSDAGANLVALSTDPDQCSSGPTGPSDSAQTTSDQTTTTEPTTTETTTTTPEPEPKPQPEPEPKPQPEPTAPAGNGGNGGNGGGGSTGGGGSSGGFGTGN